MIFQQTSLDIEDLIWQLKLRVGFRMNSWEDKLGYDIVDVVWIFDEILWL